MLSFLERVNFPDSYPALKSNTYCKSTLLLIKIHFQSKALHCLFPSEIKLICGLVLKYTVTDVRRSQRHLYGGGCLHLFKQASVFMYLITSAACSICFHTISVKQHLISRAPSIHSSLSSPFTSLISNRMLILTSF